MSGQVCNHEDLMSKHIYDHDNFTSEHVYIVGCRIDLNIMSDI